MKNWIIKCNPAYFNLDERLKDSEPSTTWRVTRYRDEIKSGDIGFVWVIGDKRVRGIRAIMRVDSDPIEMDEIETEKEFYTKPDYERMWRVKGTYLERFPLVSAVTLKEIPTLSGLSVFHGVQQPTNHKVSDEEGQFLMQYVKGQRPD